MCASEYGVNPLRGGETRTNEQERKKERWSQLGIRADHQQRPEGSLSHGARL